MIDGELVNLRPKEVGDVDRAYHWINDGEVTRFLNMRYPISLAAEEAWMQQQTASPGSYHDAHFAIETKDGGHIGFIDFHETSVENRCATLGIMIGDKTYWSKGYGTDAMRTLVRFGFEAMNLHRIQLTVDARNKRAQACYRKCGFVEEARLRQHRYAEGELHDTLWMGVLRDEWEARR
jgi:RimJ/RimL family protein N-acetyltransferase